MTIGRDGFASGVAGRLCDIHAAARRAMFALYDDDGPGGEPLTLLDYTAAFYDPGSNGARVGRWRRGCRRAVESPCGRL